MSNIVKKHISIIGTCCSRELFNHTNLGDIFDVDAYGFHVCPFDLFGDNLDVGMEEIQKVNTFDFYKRMLHFDLNKCLISEIEKHKSEYLMIDFDMIANDMYLVEIDGKKAYIQEYWRGKCLNEDREKLKKHLKITPLYYSKFDKSLILNGLVRLASWAKKTFDDKKIIINRIKLGDRYINKENKILEYEKCDYVDKKQKEIRKYEDFIINLLPNSIVLKQDDVICDLGLYDDYTVPEPQRDHYTFNTYSKKADLLIEKLGIDHKPYSTTSISSIERAYQEVKLRYLKEQFISNRNKFLTLNNYFSRSGDLSRFVVIISVRDESKSKIHKFTESKNLGIGCKIGYRDSYIAVIDKRNNFVYENSSKGSIEYKYEVAGRKIKIKSSGYNCENISSITVDGEETSLNSRGFNIVLLDSETGEIIDKAYCDTHDDDDLIVHSDRFRTL